MNVNKTAQPDPCQRDADGAVRSRAVVSEVHSEPVNLGHLVREVLELVAKQTGSRQVAIQVLAQIPPMMVGGVPIALSQIVLNAVRNAIEALASAPVCQITLSYRSADGQVMLRAVVSPRHAGLAYRARAAKPGPPPLRANAARPFARAA